MRVLTLFTAAAAATLISACSGAAENQSTTISSDANLTLAPVVTEDIESPWGMTFLPTGDLLFTEQERGLRFLAKGAERAAPVTGLPPAFAERQGGYLGLTLDPNFTANRNVFVAYSKGTEDTNATAVVRGRLSDDHTRLEDVTEIFVADTRNTSFHFGSRLQFIADGTLMVALGDGFKYMDDAQVPANTHGSIVRINADGSIPADNPFASGEGGHPAVWSYGHRNVQGLYFDKASGTLFATEHGPKGGDELNIITKAANYGWPVITYGVNYDGTIITKQTEADGMEQPQNRWVPSIAPSGLTMLTSDVYPGWTGDLFSGAMNGPKGLKLVRIDMEDGKVAAVEDLLQDELSIRDVAQGPDGYLYVADKNSNGIFRVELTPAE
jgi:glucose/arabinose dehydrogenase